MGIWAFVRSVSAVGWVVVALSGGGCSSPAAGEQSPSVSSNDAQIAASAAHHAKARMDACVAGDHRTFIGYLSDDTVAVWGGTEAVARQLANRPQLPSVRVEMGETKVFPRASVIWSTTSYTMRQGGESYPSFLIGRSADAGVHWHFIDEEIARSRSARRAFPDFPADLPLPSIAPRPHELRAAKDHTATLLHLVGRFEIERGKLPQSLAELAAKDVKGDWMITELPRDPWGGDYVLQVHGDNDWSVICTGRDRALGTADDISSRTAADRVVSEEVRLAAAAERQVRAMLRALVAKDFVKFASFVPRRVIDAAGGEFFAQVLAARDSRGPERFRVMQTKVFTRGAVTWSTTTYTLFFGDDTWPTFVVGRSGDGGKSWEFVDQELPKSPLLRSAFPDFPEDLPLPDVASSSLALKRAKLDTERIALGINVIAMATGKPPSSLTALAEKNADGFSFVTELPVDPWGGAYELQIRGDNDWAVVCKGPDGKLGTDDDVTTCVDPVSQEQRLVMSARRHAQLMFKAMAAQDFAKFAIYMPQKLLDAMGGVDAAVAKLSAAGKVGDAQVELEDTKVFPRADIAWVLVRYRLTENGVAKPSTLLGRSADDGASWVFVDAPSTNDLTRVFVDFPQDLPMPKAEPEQRTKVATAELHVKQIANGVQMFKMTNGKLPEKLTSLIEKNEHGEALLEDLPRDPWGNDYVLDVRSARNWAVVSKGPDGQLNTDDDISSRTSAR